MSTGFSLTLPKALASVEAGRLALLAYLEPFALAAPVINRLEVIFEELVSNVVRHAPEATYVALSAAVNEGLVCLSVEDDGAAFNPLLSDGHTPFDRLENAQIGGLGIVLVKRLSRSLDYERIGQVNRVRLVVAP
jgi:serine/threonine-protein kinase RsbW